MQNIETVQNKGALCGKIREIYPDIGECGIDVNVDYDDEQKSWTVDLKHGGKQLKTFISEEDASLCMEGVQCVNLGLEISQLKDSIERMPTGNQ